MKGEETKMRKPLEQIEECLPPLRSLVDELDKALSDAARQRAEQRRSDRLAAIRTGRILRYWLRSQSR